jgi:hypothetical protein
MFNNNDTCPICIDGSIPSYIKKGAYFKTNCRQNDRIFHHAFHRFCIEHYMRTTVGNSDLCPSCQTPGLQQTLREHYAYHTSAGDRQEAYFCAGLTGATAGAAMSHLCSTDLYWSITGCGICAWCCMGLYRNCLKKLPDPNIIPPPPPIQRMHQD